MIRVGIPRALLYYQYYPTWKTFFEKLGAEVIVSPPTTQAMLSAGSSRVVADTCLPVKAFMGHVLYLVGKCDYIFVPAVRSVKIRVYNCPKFLGLPDVTRAVIPESQPILDINIDINKGQQELYRAIYKVARPFTRDKSKIREAAAVAWRAYLDYQRLMSGYGLMPPQAIELISLAPGASLRNVHRNSTSAHTTIAIIGHPYLLYDELISHRLIQRLEQVDNKVLAPEMLTVEETESAISRAVGRAYWTCEEEIVGAGEHYLKSGTDGVIGAVAFGCGPDSLMMDIVRRQARTATTPFMILTLDEHTADAGMVTRLEAFLDMISRKRAKNYASRIAASR